MANETPHLSTNLATGSDTQYRLCYATMRYDYVSPAIERLLGYSAAEFMELSIRDLIEETRMVPQAMQPVTEFAALEAARLRGEVASWQADYRIRTKDGRSIWVADVSHPWVDVSGTVVGSIGCLRDITERVHAEQYWQEERVRMANYDALTGLYHRDYFFSRLEHEMARVRRSQADLSLLVIDLDQFHQVNAVYGRPAGDRVLQEIARRVYSCGRNIDLVARIESTEFAVMLPDTSSDGAALVAERVRQVISEKPIIVDDTAVVSVTASVGLAEASYHDANDATALYRLAGMQLYIAKNSGRNQVSMDALCSMH